VAVAARAIWKGYLKLSLVSCAVELSNATSMSEKIHFRTLNRKTGNPVKRQYIDAVTGEPVAHEDEVKGYETDDDQFLLVEDEEIDAIQIESSHTLAIDSFVQKASIEQIYLDAPYYMTPADKVSEEAFAVIREAMATRGMAGLARIVLYRRERPVVIEPLENGLLLTTLRYNAFVRRPETAFGDLPQLEIDPEMVELAGSIIDRKQAEFDPSNFRDAYEEALAALIRAKQEGRAAPTPRSEPQRGNVVNLFDALKRSLAGANADAPKSSGKRPADAPRAAANDEKPAPKAAAKTKAEAKPAAGKQAAKQTAKPVAKPAAKPATTRTRKSA
jgi:DNA end-binding protein Ku